MVASRCRQSGLYLSISLGAVYERRINLSLSTAAAAAAAVVVIVNVLTNDPIVAYVALVALDPIVLIIFNSIFISFFSFFLSVFLSVLLYFLSLLLLGQQ